MQHDPHQCDRSHAGTIADVGKRCNTASRDYQAIALEFLPSWKFYENPFFLGGKLAPKYVSRYLNAPSDHSANSSISSSEACQSNAFTLAANRKSSQNLANSHTCLPTAATAGGGAPPDIPDNGFSKYIEHYSLLQAPGSMVPSDLVKDPSAKASAEELHVSRLKTSMAACSIQTTLANILQRMCIIEDNQSRCNAIISKLRVEMENALSRIQELEFSHESVLREINSLLQRFGKQISTSRRREQEKLKIAFARLREEIEEEKNTCRQLKLKNKKLMEDLEEANNMVADAGEELGRERQARQLMEEVCNELAREIGEDKAEVEQLRREQAMSREMVEEELKMIRMASLWQDQGINVNASETHTEHDDKNSIDMPLIELRSKTDVSADSISRMTQNRDERQKSSMEQYAAESMQHAIRGGATGQGSRNMNAEERVVTQPFETQNIQQSHICDRCADEIQSENQRRVFADAHVDLQVRSSAHMVNYSKKPFRDTKMPRALVRDGVVSYNGVIVTHVKHQMPSHKLDHAGIRNHEAPRGIILDTQSSQHGSCSESCENEGIVSWHTAGEVDNMHNSSTSVSLCDGSKLQSNNPSCSCSTCMLPAQRTIDRKSLTLHSEAEQVKLRIENADLRGNVADFDNACGVHSYSENDLSPEYLGNESSFQMQSEIEEVHSTSCAQTAERGGNMDTERPRHCHSKDLTRESDEAHCLIHPAYKSAKILSDRVESCQEGHGDLDGFYFEPVLSDELLIDNAARGYQLESSVQSATEQGRDERDGVPHLAEKSANAVAKFDEDDHDDDRHDGRCREFSDACSRSAEQGRAVRVLPRESMFDDVHDRNTRSLSVPVKCSIRETNPATSYKLVLPTSNTIRIASIKNNIHSSRGSARSLSPSRAQVLQCFRPSSTSPDHDNPVLGALSGIRRGEGAEERRHGRVFLSRSNSHNNMYDAVRAELEKAAQSTKHGLCEQRQTRRKQGKDRRGSSGADKEEKANSLRAELLKAREMDLRHAQRKSAAPPPTPIVTQNSITGKGKGTALPSSPSSSSRFSLIPTPSTCATSQPTH
ncbi:hypothetical protein KP509_37G047400 [Ceratopteris richardii]|uniref:Uncharacterized protein n=1 Tax=Ceratopteris richardii TaxID=49495 RepID=A0A8T2Q8C5_CERRI|nr:hypothetical protein KP509_37G047400 [Ceratopteris richardii]